MYYIFETLPDNKFKVQQQKLSKIFETKIQKSGVEVLESLWF